jgi:hypothetical protein
MTMRNDNLQPFLALAFAALFGVLCTAYFSPSGGTSTRAKVLKLLQPVAPPYNGPYRPYGQSRIT